MANNTVRTIVIFGLITLVLAGAAVGTVRLMKARNNSYAASQSQPAATNNPQQAPQADQKKDEAKKQDEPKSQPAQDQNKQNSPSAAQTLAPSTPAPAPTPPSSQGASPSAVAATGATPQGSSMPATGPTDFFATVVMMMLAVFFGAKLFRARTDYRRYVGL